MKNLIKLSGIFIALLASSPAFSAVFAPVTADDLQIALNTAATNGADDTINLQANTVYNTNANTQPGGPTFSYTSAENFSLTIVGAGAGSSVLDGNGLNQVMQLTTTGADASIQVTGVTIQNGKLDFTAGLGIETVNGSMVLQDSTISNNTEGGFVGGAFLFSDAGGSATANGNTVSGNSSDFAAGIFLQTDGSITFNNNTVTNNVEFPAGSGFVGGAFLQQDGLTGTITALQNTITGNIADFVNGIMLQNGGDGDFIFEQNTATDNLNPAAFVGGVFLQNETGNISALQNIVSRNNADFVNGIMLQNTGGGNCNFEQNDVMDNTNLAAFAGGVLLQCSNGDTVAIQNTVSGNNADFVNGMMVQGGTAGNFSVMQNTVASNTNPVAFGGGLFVQGTNGAIDVINNIVVGNSAQDSGGGVFISLDQGTMNVINNTVFGNTLSGAGGEGGGIDIVAGAGPQQLNVFNNIVFGNSVITPDQGNDLFFNLSNDPTAPVQLFNNDFIQACFDDGLNPVSCDPVAFLAANQGNNINADPLFIDAAAGNFQLGAGSPAIDTGDSAAPNLPPTDHDGNPRVVGGQVDMGALEAQPDIGVNPLALDFGQIGVNQSDTLIVTISNDGSVPITVNGMDLSDEVNYSIDPNAGTNPCGSVSFTLDVGESCTVGVVFTPTSNGTFDATLTVNSDDPDEAAIVVTITGIGQLFDLSGGGCSCSLESAAAPTPYLILALFPLLWGIWRLRRLS